MAREAETARAILSGDTGDEGLKDLERSNLHLSGGIRENDREKNSREKNSHLPIRQ
nr:hypothetical protein [Caulobacter sp. SSI4214]